MSNPHLGQGQDHARSTHSFIRQTWDGGGSEPRHPDDVEADDGTLRAAESEKDTWEGGGREPRHPDDIDADE